MFLQDCIIHCLSQPVFHAPVSIYFQSLSSLDLNNKHVEILALHQFTQLGSIHPLLYSSLMALLIFEFSLITWSAETRVNEREIPKGGITFRFILLKGDIEIQNQRASFLCCNRHRLRYGPQLRNYNRRCVFSILEVEQSG